MHFCIFSYNRGIHLESCVRSVEECVENPSITIYDDASEDPETKTILANLAYKYSIIDTKELAASNVKCGGLYNNMQLAIQSAAAGTLVCFLQDDMQIVREIDEKDLDDIKLYFDSNPQAAFLQPAFLRGSNRQRDLNNTEWIESKNAYFRDGSKQSAGVHFSAISIAHADRLKAKNWEFEQREKLNDKKASEQFGKMGFMRNPFMIWVPNVPVYRNKKKTLALRIAEKVRKSGFYPMRYMNKDELESFKTRKTDILPIAEDFLHFKNANLPKPWHHHPLEGSSFLKLLNRIEVKLRK